MSFYYRRADGKPVNLPIFVMRLLTTLALAAYPAGCLLMLLAPGATEASDLVLGEIGGFALILVALLSFGLVAVSSLQRIVGEQTKHLDEFEMDLRRRGNAVAYQLFAGLTLLGLLYLGVATSAERVSLWTPSTFDHWNAVIWGALLYAFILPTTVLAWIAPAPVAEED